MAATDAYNLKPPLIEAGKFQDIVDAGQTITSAWSPADNNLAIYITNTDASLKDGAYERDEDQPVYFASLDGIPSAERRLFLTDTLIIFAALQKLYKSSTGREPNWLQGEEALTAIRKLSVDYVNFIRECWVHALQPVPRPEGLQFPASHYCALYTSFSLFTIMYLPEAGYERAPVGEDLMEWLNIHFIEPSTEEGDHLSSLDSPWEDETFWPYLTRTILRGLSKASVFLLEALDKHPSNYSRRITTALAPLVESQPRLNDFTAERDFALAFRRWSDKIKAIRIDMDRIPKDARTDDFHNWWDKLSDIVGILEGRGEVIMRVVEDLGGDWKEVVVAWCIFVDPRLRRQDLPEVVNQITADLPPDPTNTEDMIHAALFSGNHEECLRQSLKLDCWLSAHFSDLMEALQLIDSTVDDDSGFSLRDYYVLAYGDYLRSDPALWRITVDYMYSCNRIGTERADEVLIRVPLHLNEQSSDLRVDSRIRAGEVVGVLKDVNSTCFEYKRESVRRTICRVAAQTLAADKDFGLAVSYCISAEDWRGVCRIVDLVLEEYVANGPEKLTQYALAIAPSVQDLRNQAKIPGIFLHRLIFTVRYARYHDLVAKQQYQDAAFDLIAIFVEDVAPTVWWAVVLYDSITLLRHTPSLLFSTSGVSLLLQKLEEIFTRTSQGAGEDYLPMLGRVVSARNEKDVLERLKSVRLALAQYFARCLVLGVGGG